MSGISTSFTFAVPSESAAKIVSAVERDDLSGLKSFVGRNCLLTTSRNNWLEYRVHKLVEKFNDDGLSYLSARFGLSGPATGGWSVVVLRDDGLKRAAFGMQQLIASLRENAEMYAASLGNSYIEAELAGALSIAPETPVAAIEHLNTCCSANEGDDLPTLAAFLYAHRFVLELADQTTGTAIYAVWLY
jgi:hypothetical protein